ncbi:SURF1 family protein [Ideonella paludis]|uniref:SURF1-like protein n=1 Tax=Ideonella paludis TaxID=1233411 RepID=A0ABS5DWN5_9BURK|nr:SURF1 family protein [Ideonella paludis]MBQ0935562.1 SURF1 family protein [Ideonella paludis]
MTGTSAPLRLGRAGKVVVALAAVVMMLITGRLGFWQLDRAQQKLALQAAIEAQAQAVPLSASQLPLNAEEAQTQWHRPVNLRGRWQASATVFLDNRQMRGRPGFFVMTPLSLPDGSAVLVQRGWVPRDQLDRTRLPTVPTPAGEVELQGRMAPWPSRLTQLGEDAPGAIRQNLDAQAYAQEMALSLKPFSVQQTVGPEGDGLLRDWPVPAVDVHKHYGYAGQWFTFCAMIAGLYVWFQIIRPRRHR